MDVVALVAGVSVRQDRGAWEVRWRDGSGTRRAKRFSSEQAARAYDEALREVSPAARRSDTARGGLTARTRILGRALLT
jgi:hypothetical protein